jgi:hypothetical protein
MPSHRTNFYRDGAIAELIYPQDFGVVFRRALRSMDLKSADDKLIDLLQSANTQMAAEAYINAKIKTDARLYTHVMMRRLGYVVRELPDHLNFPIIVLAQEKELKKYEGFFESTKGVICMKYSKGAVLSKIQELIKKLKQERK